MTRLYFQIRLKLAELTQSSQERGVETIEWVGIGAVVVAIIAVIVGRKSDIGDAVVDRIVGFIKSVGGG